MKPRPRGCALSLMLALTLVGCGATEPAAIDTTDSPAPTTAPLSAPERDTAAIQAPPPPAAAPPAADPPAARPEVPQIDWWHECLETEAACPYGDERWLESRAGYINRFAVAGPLTQRSLRRQHDLGALVAALDEAPESPWAVRGFPAPLLELEPYKRLGKRDLAPIYVLRARVWSASERSVALKLGATGKVLVQLGEQTVYAEDSDQRLLADHHRRIADLSAGWNELWVRLESHSPYPLRFSLRLRDLDGQPLSGLAWDTAAAAPAGPGSVCEMLGPTLEQHAGPEGWTLRGVVRAKGLVPSEQVVLTLGRPGSAVALAKRAVAPETLAVGEPVAVTATIGQGGSGPLELRLDEQVCRRVEFRPRPREVERLLAAERAISQIASTSTRDSLAYLGQRVRRRLERNDTNERRLQQELAQLEALLADSQDGSDPYATATGIVMRAYRSRIDGSLQPYAMMVPDSYAARPDEPFPLIVAAHGLFYSPEDTLRIIAGKPTGPDGSEEQPYQFDFRDPRALIVAPDGYGDGGHRPPGEVDLLRVIEEVKANYRVDPRRISLTGFSLGGSVGFWAPLHHPDVFSASAPLCGYPNVREYRTVRYARKRPWEQLLLSQEGIVGYAESGRYVPMSVLHGDKDRPERSQLMVDRYEALGYSVNFEILEGMGHNVWDHAFEDTELLRWLRRQRRPARARLPRVRTPRLRFGKAYWLRIDAFEEHGEFGELQGRWRKDRLVVRTDNVTAFSILRDELGELAGQTLPVIIDGARLEPIELDRDRHFARGDAGWRPVASPAGGPGRKRRGVEGPLRDVWHGPMIIVYGTRDPVQTEANRLTADSLRRYSDWVDTQVPMLADSEVGVGDLLGRSVVLVGNPRSNSVTADALGKSPLPLRFEDSALVFGGKRFAGPGVGISTITESPFDPNHYLVLHAGVDNEGTLSARFLPEFVPDYLIYDDGIRAMWWDRILSRRKVLAGGFYDDAWGLEGEP